VASFFHILAINVENKVVFIVNIGISIIVLFRCIPLENGINSLILTLSSMKLRIHFGGSMMKKTSFAKLLFGISTLSLGVGAVALVNNSPSVKVSAESITTGSSFYVIVPSTWVANSRFCTFKFSCYGTNTSSVVERFTVFSYSDNSADVCPKILLFINFRGSFRLL